MENIVEINHLAKKYKKFSALNDINIHIPKGSIYGLIGKNGAGKTTLIRVICGLQKPNNGEYAIYGIKNNDKEIETEKNSNSNNSDIIEGNMNLFDLMDKKTEL